MNAIDRTIGALSRGAQTVLYLGAVAVGVSALVYAPVHLLTTVGEAVLANPSAEPLISHDTAMILSGILLVPPVASIAYSVYTDEPEAES